MEPDCYSSLLALWGKTDREDPSPDLYHPAIFHMIDVGNVAGVLLSSEAPARWKNILAQALGCSSSSIGTWLPYLIALHDIGKISVPFQSQNQAQYLRLRNAGFQVRPGFTLLHPAVSQVFLNYEWSGSFPVQISEILKKAAVEMAGGHHGLFAAPGEMNRNRVRLQREEAAEWPGYRGSAARLLEDLFAANSVGHTAEPPNISSAVMALTGFTVLCDWIGSNSLYFCLTNSQTLEEYLPLSLQRAVEAVHSAGLMQSTCSLTSTKFSVLFSNLLAVRPLQAAVDEIPSSILTHPCLAIIEAPTGEGKTEAALALAHRLAGANSSDELYYALPTTATSNQMFDRLQSYLKDRLGLPARVKLVHSQAFLLEDEAPLKLSSDGDGDSSSWVVMEWFSSKKRALLAPFGVGTVDQVELGALNVRHNSLRLVGLAGKVLILDEVHAYDTYMTTIIERLLAWLSALGTSVILLSATLPTERRQALLEAYGANLSDLVPSQNYPSILIVNSDESWHCSPPAAQPDRSLSIRQLHLPEDGPAEKAAWLLGQVEDGGCACWITNTVGRAQAIFERLRAIAPDDMDLLLIHSRFSVSERTRREDDIRRHYGPGGKRPTRGIVIGTQVLEQSLDIDFDVMVSDLAPIDLLLQRAGRLHRHSENSRPPAHAVPVLNVYIHTSDSGEVNLDVDSLIYAEYILRRTWQDLEGRELLRLPADYRPLIESVYSSEQPGQDHPLYLSWIKLQKQKSCDRGEAEQRLLPEPHPRDSFTGAASRLAFDENEDLAGWRVARTRLGEESVTVIPLERAEGQAACPAINRTFPLTHPASRADELALMLESLKVSGDDLVAAARGAAGPLPGLFAGSTLLRNVIPLWMEAGVSVLHGRYKTYELCLDNNLGLVIASEKGVKHDQSS